MVVVGGLWWALSGGPSHIVQIEFGSAPEVLEGADVVIDGAVVGTLERRGARTVNGFRVDPGQHSIELRLTGYDSRPTTVDTEPRGGTARLLAEFADLVDDEGRPRAAVVLH